MTVQFHTQDIRSSPLRLEISETPPPSGCISPQIPHLDRVGGDTPLMTFLKEADAVNR